jgi:adenylate kinase
MYVILLGAPGAGKGTQADFLVEKLQLPHVASGDLFRAALNNKTELGLKAKAYMEKGSLVPDEITISMVLERLEAPDCKTGALLDGFPRNIEQAKALDKALAKQKKAIDKVVYIKVADEELIKRISGRWLCRACQTPYHLVDSPPKVKGKCDKCGGELYQRSDDNAATVKNRLQVFSAETSPIIDYYKKSGKLVEVDGIGSVKDIGQRIMAALTGGKASR